MDKAIQALGKKPLYLRPLEEAKCGIVEVEEPITCIGFTTDACRPLQKGLKSITVLFDFHNDIPSCGEPVDIGQIAMQYRWDDLPEPIRFKGTPPSTTKMDFVHVTMANGNVDVLKVLYLPRPMSFQAAEALCSGKAYIPVFRSGPWNIKKGVQWLLNHLGGYQLRWFALEEKTQAEHSSKPTWSPSRSELEEGIYHINAFAPECDALNEQTLWILLNIKPDSSTPIAGWPEAKVRQMCQNKSKGLGGAVSMTEFPLTTYSLKPFLHTILLPYLYPLLINFGLLLLGCPGVGKTPFVITLAMALGRYHVRRSGCEGLKAGWRRAKSLDNFRHKAPQVQEALFLDDPDRSKVCIADLKSFLTCDEDGTVESRYNDTKMLRNQMRAYASNDLAEERFDCNAGDTVISEANFFSLLDEFFRGDREKDVLAVLKRSIVFMFGNHALYLRLPSAHRDAIVHRICLEDVHLDLLGERDKPLYGKYKGGTMETGSNFDAEILQEQEVLEEGFQKIAGYENLQDYVAYVNHKLQDKLLFRSAHVVPPSSCPSTPEANMDVVCPVPPIGTQPSGRRRGNFVYPDRRLRAKTSPPPSQHIEELAEDAEAAYQDPMEAEPEEPKSMDLEADEEAAHYMGLNGM